ncbi:MAG: hypothetical protein SGI77_24110 [Pirellulaceae bacterium]|nr:hypothetical protein [Pirellulaceae bacterium]
MVDFTRERTCDRHRKRSLVFVALGLICWIAIYQLGAFSQPDPSKELNLPPQLWVDLQTASEEELQLLPDVGAKTAKAWRQSLDDDQLAVPRNTEALESLPSVGFIRSRKLAPYLIE